MGWLRIGKAGESSKLGSLEPGPQQDEASKGEIKEDKTTNDQIRAYIMMLVNGQERRSNEIANKFRRLALTSQVTLFLI
jgi:hypothetical protein